MGAWIIPPVPEQECDHERIMAVGNLIVDWEKSVQSVTEYQLTPVPKRRINMNVDKLREQLKIDEGCVYEIYLDHLGYPTFGIGHLVVESDPENGRDPWAPPYPTIELTPPLTPMLK